MCHSTCVKMCFALPQGAIESATGKSIELYLKLRAADFGLRTLSRSAEGFRVLGLGRRQMHCLPEAGL